MGRKYAVRSQEYFHFVTFTVVGWLDIFTRIEYRDIVLDSIRYCQKHKSLVVGAWCIMTNHVHMIIRTNGEFLLQDVVRDMKSYTSRHIRKYMEHNPQESRKEWLLPMLVETGLSKSTNKDFQLWQHSFHPVELSTNQLIDQKLEYLHHNPVKAGFIDEPEHWLYSSARDYAGGRGLLEVYYLE